VFPAGGLGPVRIDVTDGRVTAISTYDPATQRTTEAVSEIVLDAARLECTPFRPDTGASRRA